MPIVLKNVNKIYPNNVHAVHDFNLEIKDKEFIVFVGPSGCGKSTTLRMIAGLEGITTGEFYIDGKLMNFVPSKDRNISMVFQNYALYPHMNVYKNMSYGLSIKKEYLPFYEKSEEIENLLKEIKSLKKQSYDLEKKLEKNQSQGDFQNQYFSNYEKIENLLDEVMQKRKPVIGTDCNRIKRLKKELKDIDNEISYVNDLLDHEHKSLNKDDEFESMLNKDLESILQSKKEKEVELEEVSNHETNILKLRHYYDYEIDKEIFHAAKILNLREYLYRFPANLSGGQRQRVALGRAIVRKPRLFLMDEPLSNLDAKLRVQTRGEISSIHQKVEATTIYVTHDQTEAMTLADRIVVMKDGYVQQIDKPMDAFNDPNNMFVAGFIGSPSMNFIKGKFDGKSFVVSNGESNLMSLKLKEDQISLLKDYLNKNLILGIRPENMLLSKDDGFDFQANINNIELLGNEFVLYGSFNNSNIAIKTNELIDPNLRGLKGIKLDLDKLYFFDKESESRIRNEK